MDEHFGGMFKLTGSKYSVWKSNSSWCLASKLSKNHNHVHLLDVRPSLCYQFGKDTTRVQPVNIMHMWVQGLGMTIHIRDRKHKYRDGIYYVENLEREKPQESSNSELND